MKKLLFTLIVAMSFNTVTFAQYYANRRPKAKHHYVRNTYRYRNYSQQYYPTTYYGFRLGMGIATVHSDSPFLDASDPRIGLNTGFVIGTGLSRQAPLYFETGLFYTEKGGKSTFQGDRFSYGLNYLEVPLVLKYRYYAGNGLTVEPFAGGYLAAGVGGKIKDFGQREAYDSFSDDPYGFKRFDGGLRLGFGLGIRSLYMEASYDIGLANIGHDDFNATRTGDLNLTLGVNF